MILPPPPNKKKCANTTQTANKNKLTSTACLTHNWLSCSHTIHQSWLFMHKNYNTDILIVWIRASLYPATYHVYDIPCHTPLLPGAGNLTKCLLPINNDGNELQTMDMDAALPILGIVCHHQKAIEALPDVVTALGPLPPLAPHYWHLWDQVVLHFIIFHC